MIYNIIGHFRSCCRIPRAESVLRGANYSDLWECRVEDWSNKERRKMFFLQSWGKAQLSTCLQATLNSIAH